MKAITASQGAHKPDDEELRQFLLAELHHGLTCTRLLVNDLTWILIALRKNWIAPNDAIEEMSEAGAAFLNLDGAPQ